MMQEILSQKSSSKYTQFYFLINCDCKTHRYCLLKSQGLDELCPHLNTPLLFMKKCWAHIFSGLEMTILVFCELLPCSMLCFLVVTLQQTKQNSPFLFYLQMLQEKITKLKKNPHVLFNIIQKCLVICLMVRHAFNWYSVI